MCLTLLHHHNNYIFFFGGGVDFFRACSDFFGFLWGVLLVVGWWVVVVAFPRLVARLLLCVSIFLPSLCTFHTPKQRVTTHETKQNI
jgi:hypothetical protein